MSKTITRRRYLKTAAASAGAIATMSTSASAQAVTFKLDLTSDGWVGQAPDAISGKTNPTLEVEAGKDYAIQWTNRLEVPEGSPGHNLVIMDEDRSDVVRSNYVSQKGASQTVSFTATSDLTAYFCENHTGSRGEFSVSGGTTTATPTPTSTPTSTPTATTTDGGGGETTTETTSPGFGALAAIAGVSGVALRKLTKNDD